MDKTRFEISQTRPKYNLNNMKSFSITGQYYKETVNLKPDLLIMKPLISVRLA